MSHNTSCTDLADEVHQAQGMVSVQAGCSLDRALELMIDTAEATGETLQQIADEVVAMRVSFRLPTS